MRRPRLLVVSQIPPPIAGLSVNMQLYLESSLFDDFELTCVNLCGPRASHKNPDRPSFGTALDAFLVVARLPGLIRRRRPDLVYLKVGTKWGCLRDMLIIRICQANRLKLICHLHTKPAGTLVLDNPLLRALFRRTMRYPSRIIAVTDELRRRYDDLLDLDKTVVIDAIVDTSAFAPDHSVPSADLPTILFLGRLTPEKGILDLLAAAREVLETGVEARFELAGGTVDAAFEARVRSICAAAALADRVRLLGPVEGDAKIAALQRADILVLPTHDDNVPNAILEGMAMGIPQVASDVGQIASMIDDGVTGFVVPPGDPAELAAKLRALIESRPLREQLGAAARRKAVEVYDVGVGVAKMRRLFDTVLRASAD